MSVGLEFLLFFSIIVLSVVFAFSLMYGEDYANGCESLGYTAEIVTPIIEVHECRDIVETERTVSDTFIFIQKVNGVWKEIV